jgi:hypothetical protein
MSKEWADALGLAITPLFARDQAPAGEHYLLLDGVRGSFGMSQIPGQDIDADTRSWAWSTGVLHHVTATEHNVIIRRWDSSETERYGISSVADNLDRLYGHVLDNQATLSRTISTHAVDVFRRVRSNFSAEEQRDALAVFLLMLGAMLQAVDDDVFDRTAEVAAQFGIMPSAQDGLRRISPELVRHLISAFRRPTLPHALQLETIPSLVVRHAGAMVFQDAHFELALRGTLDIFGVPEPATVTTDTSGGIHATPPGLARVLVEQAVQAYGELPREITILDPACGSGSILHEAVRTLRDGGYRGRVRLIGFDDSPYAVDMTRFLLSAAKHDWPEFGFYEIRIEQRDSLDEQQWPTSDIILMNPPFVSFRSLSSRQRAVLGNILGKFAGGRPDLSMAFLERGVQSLAEHGVIASLLPAGVLSMTHAREWRRHLLDDAAVAFLAVFGELGLFRMATVEIGCIVLCKSANRNRTSHLHKSLWVGEKRGATAEALRFLRKSTRQQYGEAESDRWSLDEVSETRLRETPNWRPRPRLFERRLQRILASVPTKVGTLFDVKQGAHPGPRDAFIISESLWQALPEQERRWYRRVAENRTIRSGQILPGTFIFYTRTDGLPPVTGEHVLREECPISFERLLQFKPILTRRRRKADRWWELAECRKWLRSPSQKIVSAYFGQIGAFACDVEGDHVVVQGYGWLPRWPRIEPEGILRQPILRAYLCIFNSLLFFQLLSERCPTVGGGQLNLSKRFSEGVPLPDLFGRATKSVGDDRILMDLAFIGDVIIQRGLAFAPRSKAEELVEILYGL